MTNPIVWEGDLDDDCRARWRGLRAHAEAMDENAWYCSVRVEDADDDLFHSSTDDVVPITGAAARKLCEMVMRLHVLEAKEAAIERRLLERWGPVLKQLANGPCPPEAQG